MKLSFFDFVRMLLLFFFFFFFSFQQIPERNAKRKHFPLSRSPTFPFATPPAPPSFFFSPFSLSVSSHSPPPFPQPPQHKPHRRITTRNTSPPNSKCQYHHTRPPNNNKSPPPHGPDNSARQRKSRTGECSQSTVWARDSIARGRYQRRDSRSLIWIAPIRC